MTHKGAIISVDPGAPLGMNKWSQEDVWKKSTLFILAVSETLRYAQDNPYVTDEGIRHSG